MEVLMGTQIVSILLTKYSTKFSKAFGLVSGYRYTHASIGLDDGNERFFSFNSKKGFSIERPERKKKDEQCIMFRLSVTQEAYEDILDRIAAFETNPEKYRYSYIGVLLCLLHIRFKFRNRYFCSQFVSEILSLSGAARLIKPAEIYLPEFFHRQPGFELCYQGTLKGLAAINN
jgi:hypothetical protein